MHYVIGLLIVIILLLIFGPWLLVAIGVLLGALLMAIVWLIKHVVIPLIILAAILAAIAAVVLVALLVWTKANQETGETGTRTFQVDERVASQALPTVPRP